MNARVFGALLLRDAIVAKREIVMLLIRTALQPVLFVVVFGFLLPRMGIIPHAYTTTVMPGVIALCLTMASIWAVAIPMMTDFGMTKEIEDRLLAPVPIELVAIEKVVSGLLQGFVSAAVVLPLARLIMGPIPGFTLRALPSLIAIMLLGGAVFSALGLFLGTAMQPQHVSVMMSVIFVPMIMFGCAYYPWSGLDAVPVLKYLVLLNPLTYVSEGLRAALTPGVRHMPLAAIVAALLGLLALFVWLGLRSFRKRAVG